MKRILICFLLLCNFCLAKEWIQIDNKVYLSTGYTFDQSHNVYFWMKRLRENSKQKIEGKDFSYTKQKLVISCDNRMARIDTMYVYDIHNEAIGAYTDSPLPWQSIEPGSSLDIIYKYACYMK